MSKYIDVDKLNAHIEKLFPGSSDERIVEGFEYALDKVKAIIDSLQQEQPEVDLENEIDTYFQGWTDCDDYSQALNAEGECVCVEEVIDIARHFFNLGLNARKEKKI